MVNEKDIVEALRKQLADVRRHADRLEAALNALGYNRNGSEPQEDAPPSDFVPPIRDILSYLGNTGAPTPQNQIIREVGEIRARRYPEQSNHYSNVWRALEYHVRHNRLIVCVDQEGRPAELKPLDRRHKGRKLTNSPELYDGDNWFQLKEPVTEHHGAQLRL